MYIVAIAWIYVVLLMSLTERSVIAGIMTFLLYCVLPLVVILYLIGTPQRKRKREAADNLQKLSRPDNQAGEFTAAPDATGSETH
jgi:hypothetical protein